MRSAGSNLLKIVAIVLGAAVAVTVGLSVLDLRREGPPLPVGASAAVTPTVSPSALPTSSMATPTASVPAPTPSSSPSSSPDAPSIPGLSVTAVEAVASEHAMTCRETEPSLADAPAALSGIACEGQATGDSPHDLQVWADYWATDAVLLVYATTTAEVELATTEEFIADVAALTYAGADPAAARQFVADNIGNANCDNPGCVTTIGAGRLVLQYGFGGARGFEISPADSGP